MAGSNRPPRERKARHDGWTKNCRMVFLEALEQSANVTEAATRVQKSRGSAYKLRDRDAAFCAAWDEAIERSMDDLFALLLDRAKNGCTRTVTEAGAEVRTIHSYSNGMALALLKLYRPTLHRKAVAAQARPGRTNRQVYDGIARKFGWPTRPPA